MIAFDSKSPVNSDRFDQIFAVLRAIKQQFKERFTLDHYMDDVNDTSLANADGFHRKITMPEYIEYDNLGIASYSPTYLSGGNQLFCKKINNIIELCSVRSYGVDQLTENGYNLFDVENKYTYSNGANTQAVSYGNGLWIAGVVRDGYTLKIAKSTDGKIFTLSDAPHPTYAIRGIAYGNGIWVIHYSGTFNYTSTDGSNWTQRTINVEQVGQTLQFLNGYFILPINNDNYIYISTDGINWTKKITPRGSYTYGVGTIRFCYDGSKWIGVGQRGYIISSTDLNTFTIISNIYGSDISLIQFYSISYLNGLYIIVGQNGDASSDPVILKSDDGVTWSNVSVSFLNDTIIYRSVALRREIIIFGKDAKIFSTLDGVSFKVITNDYSSTDIIWDSFYYLSDVVFVGYNGNIGKIGISRGLL